MESQSQYQILSGQDKLRSIEREAITDRFVKNFLDLVILERLASGPKYGNQLMKELQDHTGTQIGPSTIYPLLYELERAQYVVSRWESDEKRNRRVYTITEKGRDHHQLMIKGLTSIMSGMASSIQE